MASSVLLNNYARYQVFCKLVCSRVVASAAEFAHNIFNNKMWSSLERIACRYIFPTHSVYKILLLERSQITRSRDFVFIQSRFSSSDNEPGVRI
jgi:hypothetical protein